jgi:serine O-acetyltransferase
MNKPFIAWDWQADLEANSIKRGVMGAVRAFFLDPSFTFVAWVRLFMYLKVRRFRFAGVLTSLVYAHIIKTFACEVNFQIKSIGKGLRIPHPLGIVIGANAEIGNNVTIFHNVTLGRKIMGSLCQIPVGDNATISAGAVILGPLTIGENAVIGANAVVLNDVPANTTVVGIPARPISIKS